jgi:glycosyltransferase involved in cell wall biosynthesis
MKKRILHFIESEGVYGAEQVILNLSHEMSKTADYEPIVGCIVGSENDQSDLFDQALARNIEAVKIPIANSRFIFDLPVAAKKLKQIKVDLIHSHGYKPTVFGYVISKLMSAPLTATCHLWFKPSNGPLKMRVMIAIEKFLYRNFSVVIAVSDAIKFELCRRGTSSDRVQVIKNGINVDAFSRDNRVQVRESLGLAEHDFVLINTARLTEQKAQHVLINAVAKLKDQGVPVKALIVGEGPLRDRLDKQIQGFGLQAEVSLLGFRSDTVDLLNAADVFALPSIDEGMPISLLEAVAAHLPVIATDVGDIGKLIQNETSGLIVPVEDSVVLAASILHLKNNPEEAQQYAAEARRELQASYSSEAMAKQYYAVYQTIV